MKIKTKIQNEKYLTSILLILYSLAAAGCFNSALADKKKPSTINLPGMSAQKIVFENEVKASSSTINYIAISSAAETSVEVKEQNIKNKKNEDNKNIEINEQSIEISTYSISSLLINESTGLIKTDGKVQEKKEILKSPETIKTIIEDELPANEKQPVKKEIDNLKNKIEYKSENKIEENGNNKNAIIKMHKVAAGDTLPGLAEKYYGDRSKWIKIYEANKDKIEKGFPLPGEQIVIP